MKRQKTKASFKAALAAMGLFAASTAAQADQVFNDDVIITFSLCVGNDCVNGESFGFDTLRLKENNLRIHFQDTSTSASFPSNDWRFVANDSTNGGGNYMAIEDSTAGRQVFRVDAGAPANSLRVDSGGDVGIGEDNPVVELHVVDGDSPTLRLEQDGSSGFTPQTFDLVSNEANFFIRDVTNGSQLPFRIKPGADSDSLYIDADNDIGMGTASPDGSLHVVGSGGVLIDMSGDGGAGVDRPVHVRGNGDARRAVRLEQTTANTRWDISNFETTASEGAGNFGISLGGVGLGLLINQSLQVRIPNLASCTAGIQTDANGVLSCL